MALRVRLRNRRKSSHSLAGSDLVLPLPPPPKVFSVRPGRLRKVQQDQDVWREAEGGRQHQHLPAHSGEMHHRPPQQPGRPVGSPFKVRDVLLRRQLLKSLCVRTKSAYIPFRESKLTKLFQAFFCGRGKASMIVNVNQCASTYDETLHVMKFSAVAKQVSRVRANVGQSWNRQGRRRLTPLPVCRWCRCFQKSLRTVWLPA